MRVINDPYFPGFPWAVRYLRAPQSPDIRQWLELTTLAGSYHVSMFEVLFELEEDAVMFLMVWG